MWIKNESVTVKFDWKIQFLVGRLTAMGYNYVTKQKQIPQAGNYRNKEESRKTTYKLQHHPIHILPIKKYIKGKKSNNRMK